MLPIAITGAAGRMGQRLLALSRDDAQLSIVGALERADHPKLGKDAGETAGVGAIGIPLKTELDRLPRVLIDFTTPASMRHWLSFCASRRIAMVIGTTGLSGADHSAIDEAAAAIPILQAPNMSLGVAVLCKIAGEVAKILGEDYDIEIMEAHHRFKKDAPSGTAMGVADAILHATGKTRESLIYDRHGNDALRKKGDIGMHALRMGDEIGCHTAYFANIGERLELTHRATNRDTFVTGALRAAKWLADRQPGRYRLVDMLGL